jgi:hypothetical protein
MGLPGYQDPPWVFRGNALYQLNVVRCDLSQVVSLQS